MRNDWLVAGWIRHSGVRRYALEAADTLYICSEAPEVSVHDQWSVLSIAA